jgi:uncharacterized protein YecE (DUF72 family)
MMKIRVGTSGYSYKEWKGSFYPDNLPAAGMLAFYAKHFSTVEINNTFYRMPTEALVQGWADGVPEDFSFVLKAPQRITHQLRLKAADDAVGRFLRVAAELGKKQGPLLFQLPPNFKKDTPRLAEFLAHVPQTVRAAFEFRHDSWHADDVYDALRERGAALCIAETAPGGGTASSAGGGTTPLVPTAAWGYLRLREIDYSEAQLAAWADRIRAQPWSDAYVFFKHEDEGRGPKLAAQLAKLWAGAADARPEP